MAELKMCKKCGKISSWNSYFNGYVCECGNIERIQTTNADRIRAMSNEELCKFLYSHKFFDMCEEGCSECRYVGDCESRLAEWLQQPAERGAE